MSRQFTFLGAVILVLTFVCVQSGHAQTSQDSKSDEAAIRKIVQQVQDGWMQRAVRRLPLLLLLMPTMWS
jgi:hypothetical protein